MRNNRILVSVVVAALLVLGACGSDEPEAATDAVPTPTEEPKCPLTGLDAPSTGEVDRPAIAVKVENNSVAYPLSGLEDAEIVFEELVEGGLTRLMAIYHCTDSKKIGPIRSARIVDPAIQSPITLIQANAGGNAIVRKALDKADIVTIDEDAAGNAMRRVERPGISMEHTLYGNSVALRKIGQKKFDEPPASELFTFGDPPAGGKKVKTLTLHFSAAGNIGYRWNGSQWLRSDGGEPLMAESGGQIAVDNVIIEQHTINYSRQIVDAAGNPSVDIADAIGSGAAILFRDGKMFRGKWSRKTLDDPVVYTTKSGEPLVLNPGVTWIELLPDQKGELKGSFETSKK
ncbi:MAG: DUF3048 domain-containing protein [Actinomycetota bacterium]